ncbi:MAG: hypothetical protein HYX27_13265 [Acidobacteria bacterium]|nr:hypothetical protein [Acidobacteriota bacterium]
MLTVADSGWVSFAAVKRDGGTFGVHVLRAGERYLLQEGTGPVREFRHGVTGRAVMPGLGGWEQLFPAIASETVSVLGHTYRRAGARDIAVPAVTETVYLRPDMWVGPASNARQKDETRRWDGSEYEYERMVEADYRAMAEAGVTCVRVDEQQSLWAERLGLFYWGTASLPYPEMMYKPQYLGPVLFLDEPAVGTRDHVLRPRLAADAAYRKAITPAVAMAEFEKYFAASTKRAGSALMGALRARKDVDIGTMNFAQANLYSWETMEGAAGFELGYVSAFVWEPAGRVGTLRTVPEWNMSYGTQFPMRQDVVPAVINAFLRGAARLNGKQWGISIYGAVDRSDAPYWLTRAYDDGATRFFFWDNYQLACVPFAEVLALSRHLRDHARAHPRSSAKASLLIAIPPGYNLGHVHMGKGLLWGLTELHRERSFGGVMQAAFLEMEKAMAVGEVFDVVWDFPQSAYGDYERIVRIGEDARPAVVRNGPPLDVELFVGADRWVTGRALTRGDVYYTTGADAAGVYRNARFYWELYGPEDEDMAIIPAGETVRFRLGKRGKYRVRVAAVDRKGRSMVVWRELRLEN